MDVKYVNPFIEAVDSVFTTMLSLRPTRSTIRVATGNGKQYMLTALVGISGQVSGVVALRFPPDTALRVAGRMLDSEPGEINDEVIDVISELANMVAGSAKAKFGYEPPLQIGLPTVVEGTAYRVKYPSGSMWLEIPYESEAGEFSMEITYGSK